MTKKASKKKPEPFVAVCFKCKKDVTQDDFCFGCKQYVCEPCNVNALGIRWGGHDVEEHYETSDPEEEA